MITQVKQVIKARNAITEIEKVVRTIPGATVGDSDLCPLRHSFAEGMYMREIFIPKGTIVVGKIHKHSHPNFLMVGDVSVFTDEEGPMRIKAPYAMISPAGIKRVVYANEDSIWVTVHATNETDLEKIEAEVIAKTYEELPNAALKKLEGGLCLGQPQQQE